VNPPCSRSSPTEPYIGSAIDWVAMTPRPGSAKGTLLPTANAWDWVATPISPVPGSRATIEYVTRQAYPPPRDERQICRSAARRR
jgi:hypothetical protein